MTTAQRKKDQKILDIVLKHNLPCAEWTIKYIKTLPCAMKHFNFCETEYKKKYLINCSNNNSKKRNKKIFDIKLMELKELMITNFIEDYCEKRHITIKKKNTIITNHFFKEKIKEGIKNKFIINKDTILKALNLYFSFGSFENDYYNKIGVLKYNSKTAREFYLNTGKVPYEII